MSVTGSSFVYSMPALHQLARDLAVPGFVPNDDQKMILIQALRLLDLELSYQANDHPEVAVTLAHWLNSRGEEE